MRSKLLSLYTIALIFGTTLTFQFSKVSSKDEISYFTDNSIPSNVEINLYLPNDPDFPYELNFDTIPNAPFNRNVSTKIIIHGWLDNSENLWVLLMKDKYFLNGPANVVIVDWSAYAKLGYIYASQKTEDVAEHVSYILASLYRNNKLNLSDTHIVGFDLGAHLAGFIGKNLQSNIKEKLDRITGLDPSKTFYENIRPISSRKRLAKTDANFVDVIHTCAGNLGMRSSIGHVDFFPNGGQYRQPGCNIILQATCSHHRAYEFYMESITSNNFIGTKCKSWSSFKNDKCLNGEKAFMGLHLNTSSSGKYYLKTNKKTPYAQG